MWFLISAVFHQVVFYQCGLSSVQSFTRGSLPTESLWTLSLAQKRETGMHMQLSTQNIKKQLGSESSNLLHSPHMPGNPPPLLHHPQFFFKINNWSIYKAQSLVCRGYSKHIHAKHTHTHWYTHIHPLIHTHTRPHTHTHTHTQTQGKDSSNKEQEKDVLLESFLYVLLPLLLCLLLYLCSPLLQPFL